MQDVIIVSTSKGRADPADVKLSELYKRKNFKQALSDIERRLKKSPNERLLVNKALVLHATGEESNQKAALKIVEDVVAKDIAFLDKEILFALDGFSATVLLPEPQRNGIFALWERAAKSTSFDNSQALEFFEYKLLKSDYVVAQKISQSRMKANREWRVRYIISTHLAAYSPLSNSGNKTMLGNLVCKILERDFENAVKDSANAKRLITPNLSPANKPALDALNSLDELRLALMIFVAHGQQPHAIQIMKRLIKLTSLTPKESILLRKNLNLLEASEDWEDMFQELFVALSEAANVPIGDRNMIDKNIITEWAYWKALATATHHLNSQESERKFLGLIKCQLESNYRTARLAEMHFEGLRMPYNPNSSTRLAELFSEYFRWASSNQMCFRDLRSINLSDDDLSKCLADARSHSREFHETMSATKLSRTKWIISEINSLKQDYYRVISKEPNTKNRDLLKAFVSTCLRLYKVSLTLNTDLEVTENQSAGNGANVTEGHPGDDAAILAVMAIVHLHNLGYLGAYEKCVVILERVLAHSPHNYDALALAVRCYLCLALPDRAISLFRKLDVKNLQHSSISWILITRLSTLAPHEKATQTILEEVSAANAKLGTSYSSSAVKFLNDSNWEGLIKYIEHFEAANSSIASSVAYAELSTCNFLANKEESYKDSRRFSIKKGFDLREFNAFPDYESQEDKRSISRMFDLGPLPLDEWVFMRLQSQDVRRLLGARLYHGIRASWGDVWRSEYTKAYSSVNTTQYPDLTGSEHALGHLNFQIYSHIARFVNHSSTKDWAQLVQVTTTIVEKEFTTAKLHCETLTKAVKDMLNMFEQRGIPALRFNTIHMSFIIFEWMMVLMGYLKFIQIEESRLNLMVGFKPGWLSAKMEEFKGEISFILNELTIDIKKCIKLFQEPAVVERLVGIIVNTNAEYDEISVLLEDHHFTDMGTGLYELSTNICRGWAKTVGGMLTSAELLLSSIA